MRCYYHTGSDVVATCTECGKGLCYYCASKWEPILCDDCARGRIAAKRAKLKGAVSLGFIILVASGIIGIISAFEDGRLLNIVEMIMVGWLVAGFPNGWILLSRIQPSIFLFLPLAGWLFYFMVKGFLSFLVGLVAFPINVYRYVRGSREADEMEKRLRR